MKAAADEVKTRRAPRGRRELAQSTGAQFALFGGFLLVVGMAVTYPGCSDGARYHVLSLFFDGVPFPACERDEEKEGDEKEGTGPKKPGGPIGSVHAPFEKRECFKCHDMAAANQSEGVEAGLCQQCHPKHFRLEPTDWVHGPMALGDCQMCHRGHESKHEGLLPVAQQDLCTGCHGKELLARPHHKLAGTKKCSTCHDPHFSGNRLLLVDGRSYLRSKADRRPTVSMHTPWKEHKCDTCHTSDKSNQLIPDIDAACRSCHEKEMKAPEGKKLHEPVSKGKCNSCHSPHESSKPHLVRLGGEEMCSECHTLEKLREVNHVPLVHVDCLVCHTGHLSDRPYLLRPGIPTRRPPGSAPESAPGSDNRTGPAAELLSGIEAGGRE